MASAIPFYDTCALLDLKDRILESKFIISSVSLYELEHIKVSKNKDEETKYRARKVIKILDENSDIYEVIVPNEKTRNILMKFELENTYDNIIISCAAHYNDNYSPILFISNDICCRTIARDIAKLNVYNVDIGKNIEEYKGFKDVSINESEIANFYEHMNENIYKLFINQYLILRDSDGKILNTYKWDGFTHQIVKAKSFKSVMFDTLKPLDEIQTLAFDSISNNDITVLYGKAGSGKTTIPLNYIMQNIEKGKYKKFYMIYSYEPLKGAKTLGYEKGSHDDKLLMTSSIGNILSSKFGSLDYVRGMLANGTLEIIPTANIRGVEFENAIVMVTEAQNLDTYTLKTIIQRCKSGCKQIYEGDIIEQKDVSLNDNGISRMIEIFKGNNEFGCVKLKNNYRSPFCELADKM